MEMSSQPPADEAINQEQPAVPLGLDARWDIVGLLLVAAGIVSLLALFSITPGTLSSRWAETLRFFFGWGAYFLAPVVALGGLALIVTRRNRVPHPTARKIAGAEILLLTFLGLLHLIAPGRDSYLLASQGQGGGVVGWALESVLIDHFGVLGSLVILLVFTGIGMILAFDITSTQIGNWLEQRADSAANLAHRLRALRLPELDEEIAPPSPAETIAAPKPPAQPAKPGSAVTPAAEEARAKVPGQKATPAPKVAPATRAPANTKRRRPRPRKRKLKPPPLTLLRKEEDQNFSAADARAKAKVIEETLASFGVPARVVEINSGPAITQFGVKPGYTERKDRAGNVTRRKVKVSKITALADDLALALAASSVRMEAPIPGRPVIGIEVPNGDISHVSLRRVMESQAFRRLKSPLRIAMGRNVSGAPVAADLAAMPHLLIAGATGSGKSVCINSIIAALLFKHTPETLQLLMIDPKMVELVNFNGIPHLIAPVVVELEQVIGALTWAMQEMEDRYKRFAKAGVRNLATYNQKMAAQKEETLPHIVILIDELADLMMSAPEAVERIICRIAQMARATGIHLVVATQRPSVDVVTGLIKANFPARISFAVTSQVDSRVILDMPGAEKLLGHGDMLFLPPDAPSPVRLQGCFVSDEELDSLVEYWISQAKDDESKTPEATEVPWQDIEVTIPDDDADELLPRAIAIARQHDQISASFLQRKLHIGYNRAARLMDELEAQGIVGPAQSGGRSRDVLLSAPEESTAAAALPATQEPPVRQEPPPAPAEAVHAEAEPQESVPDVPLEVATNELEIDADADADSELDEDDDQAEPASNMVMWWDVGDDDNGDDEWDVDDDDNSDDE